MSADQFVPARVRLALTSRPEAGRLVRSMSSAAGEALAFDAELLSDVNTAVSEACNNAILHAYADGPGPFSVEVAATADGVEVEVRDHGRGIRETAPDHDGLKVGLALMSALADRAEFGAASGGGTEVRLAFRRSTLLPAPDSLRPLDRPSSSRDWRHRRGPGQEAYAGESALAGRAHLQSADSGSVVLSVSPVRLLAPILGGLGRALAPAAGFSAEGCANVYLVTDALGAHAERAAREESISVALGTSDQRMEFALAPLRSGMSSRLGRRGSNRARAPLAWLTDEVTVDDTDGYDTLLVAMRDHRRT